jgi:hypothetical protein
MRQTNPKAIFAALFTCMTLAAQADVTLAWNPASGAVITNYTVFWGTNTGVYTFDTPVGAQTNIIVTGLTPGTVYYFSVQATASDGTLSAFSNEITFTNPAPVTPPMPPTTGGGTVAGTGTGTATGTGTGATTGTGTGTGVGGTTTATGTGGSGTISEYPVRGIPPVLSLSFSNSAPLLTISGTVGAILTIQSTTNPMKSDSWTTLADLPITNAAAGAAATPGAPSALGLAYVPALQTYQVVDTTPPSSEFYRVVMPYDYMVLADSVLSAQGDPSRLLLVTMPGCPDGLDVCYVTPQNGFLYYDATNNAFAMEPSGSTIRQIATTLATSLGQSWTSAYEFAYSNGVSTILASVVETAPASSDPVAAAASAPIISIDF